MTILLPAAAVLLVGLYLFSLFSKGDIPALVRALRWVVGGGAIAVAALLMIGGRIGIGSLLGAAGASVLIRGRLGPIDFNTYGPSPGRISRVSSRYFSMELDHDAGTVHGKVRAGSFSGQDLIDLSEHDVRRLFREIGSDADSLSLLETWLDANRAGWREVFEQAEEPATGRSRSSGSGSFEEMNETEAYDILGLPQGAGEAEIKAAHRRLLKAVHPDQGGSNALAARINAAKDFLLKKRK